MKKSIIICVSLFVLSCSEKKQNDTQTTSEITTNNTAAAEKTEGEKLIESNDCLSCHRADTKLVGPSYQEIANKYTEGDMDLLTQKILEGGSGVWGEVPMSPHSEMKKEDAQKIVKHILTLKK